MFGIWDFLIQKTGVIALSNGFQSLATPDLQRQPYAQEGHAQEEEDVPARWRLPQSIWNGAAACRQHRFFLANLGSCLALILRSILGSGNCENWSDFARILARKIAGRTPSSLLHENTITSASISRQIEDKKQYHRRCLGETSTTRSPKRTKSRMVSQPFSGAEIWFRVSHF